MSDLYVDTLVILLFIGFLIHQYRKTKAIGNAGLLLPLGMMLVMHFDFAKAWPPKLQVAYRFLVVAAIAWAFWFYIHDYRKRMEREEAAKKEQKAAVKAEKKAKQKAANAHQNPSKKKKK